MVKIRPALILLCVAAAIPQTGMGSSLDDRPLAQLLSDSSRVVEGRIIKVAGECHERTCAAMYDVVVDASYKGSRTEAISFCAYQPLRLGERYVLFIKDVHEPIAGNARCTAVALMDGVFIEGVTGIFYRYMSMNGLNRSVSIDGATYKTYLVEEAGFAAFISSLKANASVVRPRGGR